MKRTAKILGSTTGLLAAAAFSGMITGAASATSLPGHTSLAKATVGVKAQNMDDQSDKHDCKGKNSCSGKGGCATSDQGCKGKNTCKGKGGCKTNGSLNLY